MSAQQQAIKAIPAIYRMEYKDYIVWWASNELARAAAGYRTRNMLPRCIQCGDKPSWDHEGYCLSCSPLQVAP